MDWKRDTKYTYSKLGWRTLIDLSFIYKLCKKQKRNPLSLYESTLKSNVSVSMLYARIRNLNKSCKDVERVINA